MPQLGVSGYFIDFAACHQKRPGEFVLAIEADGAGYHSGATARERDRLRQEHLERLGWKFHRIWSTDWFRNREAEVVKARAAWEAACAAADRDSVSVSAPPVGAPPPPVVTTAPPATRSLPRPGLQPGESIDTYTPENLLDIVIWVASDGLLRTDLELLDEVVSVMGYQRRGVKIVDRVERAIASFHLRR